jgi:hypothetical protein
MARYPAREDAMKTAAGQHSLDIRYIDNSAEYAVMMRVQQMY